MMVPWNTRSMSGLHIIINYDLAEIYPLLWKDIHENRPHCTYDIRYIFVKSI